MNRVAVPLIILIFLAVSPTPAAVPDDRLSDLLVLKSEYLSKEQALTTEARVAAHRLLSRVQSRAADKSDAEFMLAVMRLTALANSGGSLVVPRSPGSGQARLPVRLALFDDGLLVIRGAGEAKEFAGSKVLAVNGLQTEEVVRHLDHFFGGALPRRRSLLPGLIEVPALMHAAGLASQPDRLRLRLSLRDGREVETDFQSVATLPRGPSWWPDRWSSDGYDKSSWSYANAGSMPLYLRDFEEPVRTASLGNGIEYFQLKWIAGWDGEVGLEEVKKALETIGDSPLRSLIVDLRFDHGASSPAIAAELTRLISGLGTDTKIYLLVGRYTHHNGVSTAASVMTAAGVRGTAIGEEMGDWLDGPRWAGRLCLKSIPFCPTYSSADQYDMQRSTAFRILPAPPTAESLRNGSDPALELALQLAQAKSSGLPIVSTDNH